MHTTAEHETGDLWVFGYGSLMWRPGFAHLECVPARLIGLHRSLCVFSFVHRGTPERPGLVLGLDRGGMCRGIAFRVAAARLAERLHHVRQGHGKSGSNPDYVLETVRALEALGYREGELHLLAEQLSAGISISGMRGQESPMTDRTPAPDV